MIRTGKDEPRHARVGGGQRDVEGVVHGPAALGPIGVRVRVHGAKVHHGVGAREDAAPRHAAGVGLLGVTLDDAIAGRLGALRAVVRVLDADDLDASFLEVGAELATEVAACARDDDSTLLLSLVEEPCGGGCCPG